MLKKILLIVILSSLCQITDLKSESDCSVMCGSCITSCIPPDEEGSKEMISWCKRMINKHKSTEDNVVERHTDCETNPLKTLGSWCAQKILGPMQNHYERSMECQLPPGVNEKRKNCICENCLDEDQPCDGCPGRDREDFCTSPMTPPTS